MKLIYKLLSILFIFNTCFINHKPLKSLINRVYHKIEDIDRVEILIKNPKKCNNNSIFNKYIYTLKIYIITEDSYITKTIEDNNFSNLINKTDFFISKYNY